MSEQFRESVMTKIARITVKSVGYILVFGTILFFIWRAFFSTAVPSEVKSLAPNAPLRDAYEAALAEGKEVTVFYQKDQYDTTTVRDKNYSYFTAKDARFIREANQVQILFRYHATSAEPAQSLMYNYRRLTFDGVDMTVSDNPVLAVYVDVYYLGDLDYEAEPYGTICIYDYMAENTYGTLDKKEIAALDELS